MTIKKPFSFELFDKPTLVIIDWSNIWKKNKNIDLQLFYDYLKSYKDIYKINFYNGIIEGIQFSIDIIENAKNIGFDVITKKAKYLNIDISKEEHLKNAIDSIDLILKNVKDNNNEISNNLYTIRTKIEERYKTRMIDADGYGEFDSMSVDEENVYDIIDNFIENTDPKIKELDKNINIFNNELKKPIKKIKCDFDAEISRDIILEIDNYDNLILFSGDGDFASTVEYLIKEKGKRVFVMYPQGSFGEIDYKNFDLIKDVDNKKEYVSGFICIPTIRIIHNIIKQNPHIAVREPDIDSIANPNKKIK